MKKTMNVDANALDVYPIIPEGKRTLTVELIRAETKSVNGNDVVELTIRDIETDLTLLHWVAMIENGKPGHGFFVKWLKALGQPYDGKIMIDTDQWVDKTFRAIVFHGEHNGKKYARIDSATIESFALVETDSKEKENAPW